MHIREKEKKILIELQRNSKQTIKELSQKLNIRPSTVHERIKFMEKEGIVEGYKAILNDQKINATLVSFVLVSGKPIFKLDDVIINDPRIMEIWGVTGEYDILIKARFRDIDEFSKFVLTLREKYEEQINRTETFVVTIKIKETTEKPINY